MCLCLLLSSTSPNLNWLLYFCWNLTTSEEQISDSIRSMSAILNWDPGGKIEKKIEKGNCRDPAKKSSLLWTNKVWKRDTRWLSYVWLESLDPGPDMKVDKLCHESFLQSSKFILYLNTSHRLSQFLRIFSHKFHGSVWNNSDVTWSLPFRHP